MKYRLLTGLLALALALSLTACGGGSSPEKPEDAPGITAPEGEDAGDGADGAPEAPPASPEEGEESETQDGDGATVTPPAETPQAGSGTATPSQKPQTGGGAADSTQKPESQPVQKPEAGVPAGGVDLAAFYASLTGEGSSLPAMSRLEGEALTSLYPGLGDIATAQCAVYVAMISASVGELALVEVQDGADVQAVKDVFQQRIDYQVGDDANPGGAWYPATIEGWKTNSRIVSNGNYVLLAACDGVEDVVAAFNALFA